MQRLSKLLMVALFVSAWTSLAVPQAQAESSHQRYYIDIGGDGDQYIVKGFTAGAPSDPNPCTSLFAGQNDATYLYQLMGQSNVIEIPVVPGRALHLSFCVQKGVAQDLWTLYVNGHKTAVTNPDIGTTQGWPEPYTKVVRGQYIRTDTAQLNFRNRSTDGNGAAVFGILYWQ